MLFEEVHADGLLIVSGKNALAIALDHARLANRTIANDHHLQEKKI
jgi:hypothetical protein